MRSKYDSLARRRGTKKALIAVGHKILIAAYYILKDKVEYRELGADYLNQYRKDKQIKHHLKRLKQLGCELEVR